MAGHDVSPKGLDGALEVPRVEPLYPIATFLQGFRTTYDVAAELLDRFAIDVLDDDKQRLLALFFGSTLHCFCVL